MIRKDDNDPLGPIGSRFEEKIERVASKIETGRARATSRLDREIERLRTSPQPGRVPPVDGIGPININSLVSGVPWMGIFSRTRDIIAANFNDLLDQADDPAKMIRMIILEMEETLVEVRASAARTIADGKEMRRALKRLEELQTSWTEKAELALSKDREDLAKAALIERQKAADMAEGLKAEIDLIDEALKSYEADIAKLQGKLREARARQNAIATRLESAVARAKAREVLNGGRTEDAFGKFELLERRADFAEGRADALGMTGPKSLEEEIAELQASDKVQAELEAMKAALKRKGD